MEELSIIIILHWKQRVGQFVCCSRKSDVLSLYLDRSTLFTFHEFTLVEPSVYSVFSFYLHLTLSMVLPLMFLNLNHLRVFLVIGLKYQYWHQISSGVR